MYRPNAPHGVAKNTVPTGRDRDRIDDKASISARGNGIQKMHLLNEALARARMRDLWRPEHRHKRRAGDILREVRLRQRHW